MIILQDNLCLTIFLYRLPNLHIGFLQLSLHFVFFPPIFKHALGPCRMMTGAIL
jgi:hypothetical protein